MITYPFLFISAIIMVISIQIYTESQSVDRLYPKLYTPFNFIAKDKTSQNVVKILINENYEGRSVTIFTVISVK